MTVVGRQVCSSLVSETRSILMDTKRYRSFVGNELEDSPATLNLDGEIFTRDTMSRRQTTIVRYGTLLSN
jgi:hypothetical protein